MRSTLTLVTLILIGLLVACGSDHQQQFSKVLTRDRSMKRKLPQTFVDVSTADCVNYVSIIPASKLARRLKQPKDWVANHYQIKLYADTLQQGARVIGHVPPGADCYIMEQAGDWFFVQSPIKNELGWLSKDYVVGFVLKDPTTQLPCTRR